MRKVQGILASVAVLFGLMTIVAGTRVLSGADPGYIVFRPLLIYNTAMGIVYVGAGVLGWRNLDRGKYAAAAIFVLNSMMLGATCYLYATGSFVALDSVHAMILRTGVWLALLIGWAWMSRRRRLAGDKRDTQPVIPPGAAS